MILACVQIEWCSNYCYWTFISAWTFFASLTVFIRYQFLFTQINQHPYFIINIINQLCKSPKSHEIHSISPFSYGFPMVFLCFSYGSHDLFGCPRWPSWPEESRRISFPLDNACDDLDSEAARRGWSSHESVEYRTYT